MTEAINQTILVIDDDWLNHEVLESILSLSGYSVLQASRAGEGLTITNDKKPDLIIADVNLPDMSGFVLCEAIKKNPQTRHIPVLLITGHIQGQSQRQKAKSAGAYDFIERILKPDVLLTHITAALSSITTD